MRHHHCRGLPSQGGWHPASSPQHLGSGDLTLDGVPLRPPGSAVPPGLRHRPRGRPVSPSPAPPFRVVAQPDRISFFEKSLVSPNSFICQFRRSSLFDLLLAIPGSDVSRHGRVSPVLGRSSGLRVPSGGHPSMCSRVAPGLHGDGAHPSGSTLGPAPLVLRPPPAFAGSSSVPPARQGLLRLPRSRHLSPDLSRLRLHAWRLSSDFPEPLASAPQWRSSLRWRTVHPRAQYIRCDGPFIVSGITTMAILSLVLPWLR